MYQNQLSESAVQQLLTNSGLFLLEPSNSLFNRQLLQGDKEGVKRDKIKYLPLAVYENRCANGTVIGRAMRNSHLQKYVPNSNIEGFSKYCLVIFNSLTSGRCDYLLRTAILEGACILENYRNSAGNVNFQQVEIDVGALNLDLYKPKNAKKMESQAQKTVAAMIKQAKRREKQELLASLYDAGVDQNSIMQKILKTWGSQKEYFLSIEMTSCEIDQDGANFEFSYHLTVKEAAITNQAALCVIAKVSDEVHRKNFVTNTIEKYVCCKTKHRVLFNGPNRQIFRQNESDIQEERDVTRELDAIAFAKVAQYRQTFLQSYVEPSLLQKNQQLRYKSEQINNDLVFKMQRERIIKFEIEKLDAMQAQLVQDRQNEQPNLQAIEPPSEQIDSSRQQQIQPFFYQKGFFYTSNYFPTVKPNPDDVVSCTVCKNNRRWKHMIEFQCSHYMCKTCISRYECEFCHVCKVPFEANAIYYPDSSAEILSSDGTSIASLSVRSEVEHEVRQQHFSEPGQAKQVMRNHPDEEEKEPKSAFEDADMHNSADSLKQSEERDQNQLIPNSLRSPAPNERQGVPVSSGLLNKFQNFGTDTSAFQ